MDVQTEPMGNFIWPTNAKVFASIKNKNGLLTGLSVTGVLVNPQGDSILFPLNDEGVNGDASAEGAIRAYIDNNGLDTNYEAVEDEQSLYEGTKCLVNYFNIKNREVLRAAERYFVNVRTAELFANPLKMHLSFS